MAAFDPSIGRGSGRRFRPRRSRPTFLLNSVRYGSPWVRWRGTIAHTRCYPVLGWLSAIRASNTTRLGT